MYGEHSEYRPSNTAKWEQFRFITVWQLGKRQMISHFDRNRWLHDVQIITNK